jgi:hypothetical protein
VKNANITTAIVILCAVWIVFWATAAAAIQAEAVVQQSSVYKGEPFVLNIRVSGSDQPQQPDLSKIKGFSVAYQGGSQNNSTAITIVNGKMTRNVTRGYVFSYQLTPLETGTLTIPAITVEADGDTVKTLPVRINVSAPGETEDVKLRLFLSKNACYVGEPVTLTAKLYLRREVRTADFTIPALRDTDWFYVIDPGIDQQKGKKYYRLPLNGGEVIGEQSRDTLDGEVFSTLSFSKVLIPKKSGQLTIDTATVACDVLTGYRDNRGRNPFNDDFFSDFFNTRQGVYQKVVAPSNRLTLEIRDLPYTGRPDNFAGHIGEFRINAAAAPVEVHVGDPITLTLTLSGPEYLEHITLPPLSSQKQLREKFKIPEERATAEIKGNEKIFTQTLRPLDASVTHIPAIELPYFDTKSGTYKTAETRPIPLAVKSTRIITAMDAEGREIPEVNGSEVETWDRGIAYNYEDPDVLSHQRTGFELIRSPFWAWVFFVPPVFYFVVLLTTVIIRKKHADPKAMYAKKAFAELRGDLKKIQKSDAGGARDDEILDALRRYLGARLGLPSRAIVFADVAPVLAEKGVSRDLISNLEEIFSACEAGRYAGTPPMPHMEDSSEINTKTLKIAGQLEKILK